MANVAYTVNWIIGIDHVSAVILIFKKNYQIHFGKYLKQINKHLKIIVWFKGLFFAVDSFWSSIKLWIDQRRATEVLFSKRIGLLFKVLLLFNIIVLYVLSSVGWISILVSYCLKEGDSKLLIKYWFYFPDLLK